MQLTPEDFQNHSKKPTKILANIISGMENIQPILDTAKWNQDKQLDVKLVCNDLVIQDEELIKTLTKWHEAIENFFVKKYENVEQEISKRVNKASQEALQNVIEPYQEKLEQALNNIGSVQYVTDVYSASKVVATDSVYKDFVLAYLKTKYELKDTTMFEIRSVDQKDDNLVFTVIVTEEGCKEDWIEVSVSSKY